MRIVVVAALLSLSTLAVAAPFSGAVERVHDGDTFRLAGVTVRLWGIDAPELRQECQDGGGRWYACGQRAKEVLAALVRSGKIVCQQRDSDRYGRVVAACRVDGRDINSEMVAQGWAVAYRTFTAAYEPAEVEAKQRGLGIWAGRFVMPDVWRRAHRR